MPLPPDLLLRTPEEAARRIALAFLDEAHAASGRLDDPDDAEALHDFRVGVRRLRSTLRAWSDRLEGTHPKRQRKVLKALQNATGGGRDAEVALAWIGGLDPPLRPAHRQGRQWLVDRLEKRRDDAMGHARGALRDEFLGIEEDLRAQLRRMRFEVELDTADVRETYAEALAAKCRDHAAELALHLSRVVSLEEREEAHQARITGKRLRYLLEPVREAVPEAASMVKRMKGLQDVLGELNDARVLDGELRSALEDAAVQHVRELHARVARSDEEGARRLSRRNPRTGLIEIARRGRERADALFSRLESRWLGRGIARVVGYAEKVARALEARARAGREVERKYLLTRMPELPEGAISSEIHQGWLPGDALQERLRRRRDEGGDAFTRTVKVGIGLVRTELEEKTTPDLFEALWPFTKGRRVTKRRWCVRQGDRTWEIDEFLDRDLVLAEIELEDSDEEVRIPEWLAPVLDGEVTGDARYVNVNLAR